MYSVFHFPCWRELICKPFVQFILLQFARLSVLVSVSVLNSVVCVVLIVYLGLVLCLNVSLLSVSLFASTCAFSFMISLGEN